ncbi:MAG: hypothetical protein COU84_02015 [Candidatus Portnoybacteria bacterium CG10_big_fil_rev_8_21_14_0_10_43_39]|uniref:Uncharacterized protein n=1 Tax=Candidatus Portnoybacteria bacterium CG10_big_fil_rev_8_21_14_0_10_43_39 TaxID=1974815 RepID=A0A2M8KGW5_9BACT|nr:MAG: hypothetical protein COU84_02015 [Candidatus Portnoybacteria bacterium CG10_big_fil_rev_8_21_14_0_10_43_39]
MSKISKKKNRKLSRKWTNCLTCLLRAREFHPKNIKPKNQNCSTKNWILSRKSEILNKREIIGSNR